MKSFFIGLLSTIAVIYLSMEGNFSFYLQPHSLIIVLGGTLAIFFFSTPGPAFKTLTYSVRLLLKDEKKLSGYSPDLEKLAKNRFDSVSSTNPLISYAQELWEQGISDNLFIALLAQKRMELENETIDAVQAFKNLSKYPPALGMTGTVIGMIGLFANLQDKSQVGQHLAIAMTATFLGLIVTNMVISPLADRLQVRHINRKRLYSSIYQVLLLINQNEPLQLVKTELQGRSLSA